MRNRPRWRATCCCCGTRCAPCGAGAGVEVGQRAPDALVTAKATIAGQVNNSDTVWHRLERFLAHLRPYRGPLSLVIDAMVVAVCWNVTYLFRLGFERW